MAYSKLFSSFLLVRPRRANRGCSVVRFEPRQSEKLHVLQLSYFDTSRTKDVEHTINLGYVFFTLWFHESRTIMSSLLKS